MYPLSKNHSENNIIRLDFDYLFKAQSKTSLKPLSSNILNFTIKNKSDPVQKVIFVLSITISSQHHYSLLLFLQLQFKPTALKIA
jgi:6-pyruvoyl-tetrahydropterin synthase